jgi:polysaccharide biosynthesis protein PslH
MKVLVVLTQPPLLEGGAPGKCAVGLLRGLRAHGVEVTALAARQPFAVPGDVPADLPVEVIPVLPEPKGLRFHLSRLRRPRGELGRGPFAARVREAASWMDTVHLEETETVWSGEGVTAPSLIHLHYLVLRDRPLGWPWQRQFRTTVEFALAERAARRRHRYLVASSPLVAEALRRVATRAEVVLAPLSLDPGHYTPAPLDGPPTIGIVGTGSWPPTAAAIRRLAERVWPEVRRRMPEARLRIAGRRLHHVPGLATAAGVELLGEVPSAARFLQGLSLMLYPLDRGSGVKVKVVEAMASGVPVVTTPAGTEGIEAGDGVVVAREDSDLAGAAVDILADPLARRERGAAARRAFMRRHAPRPATEPLVDLYRRMAGP